MMGEQFFERLNEIEKYILIAYLLTILISSIVGDTIILIASTRYNALKLNKFILAIIHHISVCDLVTDMSYVLPILMSIFADEWIFGYTLSEITAFLAGSTFLLSNILVVILTCSKFLLVKFPQKTRKWTAKKAHIICGMGWLAVLLLLLPTIFPSLHVNIKVNLTYHMHFHHDASSNDSQNSKDGRNSSNDPDKDKDRFTLPFKLLSYSIVIGAPTLVLTFSVLTLKLLFEARQVSRRSRGSLRWQGIITVVVTGTLFCVSMLPYCIFRVMKWAKYSIGKSDNHSDTTSWIWNSAGLGLTLQFLTFVNAASNFFIYCLTVKSFRTFLSTKISLIRSKFRCSKRVASEHSESRIDTARELQQI